jgi:hypothetical protein
MSVQCSADAPTAVCRALRNCQRREHPRDGIHRGNCQRREHPRGGIHGGNCQRRNTREACYWITRTGGLRQNSWWKLSEKGTPARHAIGSHVCWGSPAATGEVNLNNAPQLQIPILFSIAAPPPLPSSTQPAVKHPPAFKHPSPAFKHPPPPPCLQATPLPLHGENHTTGAWSGESVRGGPPMVDRGSSRSDVVWVGAFATGAPIVERGRGPVIVVRTLLSGTC